MHPLLEDFADLVGRVLARRWLESHQHHSSPRAAGQGTSPTKAREPDVEQSSPQLTSIDPPLPIPRSDKP